VRVISLGAQGIPVGGFEPTPLATGPNSQLGGGTRSTVYDPPLQEVGIARSLGTFDAQLSTDMFWNHNTAPFNNRISAGTFVQGARFAGAFTRVTYALVSALSKKTPTGSVIGITHNMTNAFSNS